MGEQHYTLAGISMKALPKQDDTVRGGEMGREFREEGNLNQGKRGGGKTAGNLTGIYMGGGGGIFWEQCGNSGGAGRSTCVL